MSDLKNLANDVEVLQTTELVTAIQDLSKQGNDGLTQYLQESQKQLYDGVTSAKDDAFVKVYGDYERASSTQNSLLFYDQRNHDLNNIQESVYSLQKGDMDAITHDSDLAKRQYEINQWASGNNMDTLFVYQQLMIIVCTTIVLLYLWNAGILEDLIFYSILFVLICIFVFTIVNRSQYTNFLRDKRFWNRRLFPTYKKIPVPNICSDPSFNPTTPETKPTDGSEVDI
uniref:Uncharacterized protein n=1 Tax=viral metagenome TaxID=1070528 RepID=A0A6C0DJN0_9ZZZZ